jgi:hypothetical protein
MIPERRSDAGKPAEDKIRSFPHVIHKLWIGDNRKGKNVHGGRPQNVASKYLFLLHLVTAQRARKRGKIKVFRA